MLTILVVQDYGWNSYPPGWTRRIFNDDLSQSIVLHAVPIASMSPDQKLPILVQPINENGIEVTFSETSHFTIKPASAGVIEIVNEREFLFIPSEKHRGLGLINVHAINSRGETVFGSIHFQVWKKANRKNEPSPVPAVAAIAGTATALSIKAGRPVAK